MRSQKILIKDARRLPIRAIDQKDRAAAKLHDELVAAVKLIISLYDDQSKVRTVHEFEVHGRRIEAVDHAIDGIVYQLYGLNEAEIKTVEQAMESQKVQDDESPTRRRKPKRTA
jgi:hypothetical protein